jgi:hypothetical protein
MDLVQLLIGCHAPFATETMQALLWIVQRDPIELIQDRISLKHWHTKNGIV